MKRSIVLILAGVIAGPAFAQSPGEGWHGHMMYGDGYGFFGYLMMFVFWAAIIVVAVLAWRSLGQNAFGPKSDTALDVLRQRLAKGEIEPEEFEARRKVLEQ